MLTRREDGTGVFRSYLGADQANPVIIRSRSECALANNHEDDTTQVTNAHKGNSWTGEDEGIAGTANRAELDSRLPRLPGIVCPGVYKADSFRLSRPTSSARPIIRIKFTLSLIRAR